MQKFIHTYSQEDTENLGVTLAEEFGSKPVTILLNGNLGAGKTAFVRGFIRQLTGDKNLSVTSPTFVLLNSYNAKNGLEVRHMDLYRLKTPEDSYDLDIDHAFENCITLIEWPEIINSLTPQEAIIINFERISDNERMIEIKTS